MIRYQHQRRLVRIVRWLRWRPWYSLKAATNLTRWFLAGAKIPAEEQDWFQGDRRAFAKHIWIIYRSMADMRMEHWYTMEEVLMTQTVDLSTGTKA